MPANATTTRQRTTTTNSQPLHPSPLPVEPTTSTSVHRCRTSSNGSASILSTTRRRKMKKHRRVSQILLIGLGAAGSMLLCVIWMLLAFVWLPTVTNKQNPLTPVAPTNDFVRRTSRSMEQQQQQTNATAPHLYDLDDNPLQFSLQSIAAPVCKQLAADDISYTLVTQLSSSRLWMMQHHCQQWGHAISLALAVEIDTNVTTTTTIQPDSFYHQQLVDMGCAAQQLSLVVVPLESDHEEYPVNVLRNRALSQVQTSHVVYLDIDFWPSPSLHQVLNQNFVKQHFLQHGDKTALVVPAYQINRQCHEYKECRTKNVKGMPRQRSDLVKRIKKHKAFQFDPTNRGGHGSTLYDAWLHQDNETLLEIPCFLSDRYEPYLVFRYCQDVPPFQAAFTGYGKNKMTWIMQLRRLGWRFWQLPTAFVTHYPHLDSPTRQQWNGGPHGKQMHRPDDDAFEFASFQRGQNDYKFLQFKQWLYQTVPDQAVIHKCPDSDLSDDDYKLWVPRPVIQQYNQEYVRLGGKLPPSKHNDDDDDDDKKKEDDDSTDNDDNENKETDDEGEKSEEQAESQ